jgi:hypothetical protein
MTTGIVAAPSAPPTHPPGDYYYDDTCIAFEGFEFKFVELEPFAVHFSRAAQPMPAHLDPALFAQRRWPRRARTATSSS